MAKIKNTTEDEPQNTESQEVNSVGEVQQEANSVTPSKKAVFKDTETTSEPDAQVLNILKTNPKYSELYIDKQGGTYSPDTLPNIRKSAIRYKNPFYKP